MTKVFTAVVLGALVLAAVLWLPPWGIYALIFAAAAAGLIEFSRMCLADEVERWAVVAAGAVMALWMMAPPAWRSAALLGLAFVFFLLAIAFMWRARELAGTAQRLAIGLMGVVYLGVCFPFWAWLFGMPHGRTLVLFALVPACLCDVFALIAGKAIGRHRLAPRVSPNKTVEGFVGALVGSLAGAFVVRWALLPQVSIAELVGFALMIWITSPLGDLVESLMKRSFGVKDSGRAIPGHGGVLDRLDALVFTGPAAYAYVNYVMGI